MPELPHSPELPAGLLTDPAMIDACRRRDFGAVFRLVKIRAGIYPSMIARRCDLTPSRVGEVMAGRRQLVHMDVVERIADGLRIPGHMLGLARRAWETPSSLGQVGLPGRGTRPDEWTVSRQVAVGFDQDLGCTGERIRLGPEAHGDARQGATDTEGDASYRGTNACCPGAGPPAFLVTDGQLRAGSAEDDTDLVVAPARVHGRIALVPVPRRIVLAAGLFGFAPAAMPLPAAASAPPANMLSPVEHFTHLRRVMIQADNLIGPRHVLPALQQHLASLAARRLAARGTDAAELLALETRYEELAGWLAQDIGDERTAQGHTARALDASHVTGDTNLTAYILGRKAQLALDTGRPAADALGLAAAARRSARPGSRLEVIAVLHEAHAHAVLGDAAGTHRTYETALSLLDRADSDGIWGSWLDASYINTARARSLATLGAYEEAAVGFTSALAALPAAYRRDRGVYLARAARAHAGAGDLPLATKLGRQAVGIAAETGSARIVEQLGHLEKELATAPNEQGVSEFRAALDRIVLRPA
ncbi:helix-turn-helix domain-containing protein [Streptomyces albidoflavus]